MAYHCVTEGMEDISRSLASLGSAAVGAASGGLYEAAGVYADEVSKGVQGISTEPFKYAAGGRKRKPSPEEKAALTGAGGAGIAKFRKTGISVNTSIGFNSSGYVMVSARQSKKARTNYRYDRKTNTIVHSSKAGAGSANVKPVAVIANAINHGTSFMDKQPFFRKAVSQAKSKAKSAFEAKANEILNKAAQVTGQSGHVYSSQLDMIDNGWKYGD